VRLTRMLTCVDRTRPLHFFDARERRATRFVAAAAIVVRGDHTYVVAVPLATKRQW
jgi:hypothetical protein